MDSNHRRHSQQIYSLPHLATLVTTRCFLKADAKVVNLLYIQACLVNYFKKKCNFLIFNRVYRHFYTNFVVEQAHICLFVKSIKQLLLKQQSIKT